MNGLKLGYNGDHIFIVVISFSKIYLPNFERKGI